MTESQWVNGREQQLHAVSYDASQPRCALVMAPTSISISHPFEQTVAVLNDTFREHDNSLITNMCPEVPIVAVVNDMFREQYTYMNMNLCPDVQVWHHGYGEHVGRMKKCEQHLFPPEEIYPLLWVPA